jgi:hypothetical protein
MLGNEKDLKIYFNQNHPKTGFGVPTLLVEQTVKISNSLPDTTRNTQDPYRYIYI